MKVMGISMNFHGFSMVFTLTHLTPIGWVLLYLFRLQLPNRPRVYARNSQLRLVEIPVQNFAGWERTNQQINGHI